MSNFKGVTRFDDTSNFEMPKSCSKTIVLPSALIAGQRTSPDLYDVIFSAFPPPSLMR
jgi:hypothetical protein